MTTRIPLPLMLLMSLAACTMATTVVPEELALPTELSSTSVLARAPMVDTARVAGVSGYVAVVGVLNQTAPCFGLGSAATRLGPRVVVRLTAQQVAGTCATFAAGAFDYDVGVKGLATGVYDVDVFHRVVFNDGRVDEAKVGSRRVEVR